MEIAEDRDYHYLRRHEKDSKKGKTIFRHSLLKATRKTLSLH